MSVFRVEKNKNYTAMSNYHFRDNRLSLKAIGLLSKMLSLPDDWDYSQAGLTKICKDGESSISSALKELELNGYLVRERERDAHGRVGGMIYHVYEVPKELIETNNSPNGDLPKRENPVQVNPVQVNPVQVNPDLDIPTLENHVQLNNNILNNNKQNTNFRYSIYQSDDIEDMKYEISKNNKSDELIDREYINDENTYNNIVSILKENINYKYFVSKNEDIDKRLDDDDITLDEYDKIYNEFNLRKLDSIISYIADFIVNPSKSAVKIGHDVIPRGIVKKKLLKCDYKTAKETIAALNTGSVKNPKSYTISVVYNS